VVECDPLPHECVLKIGLKPVSRNLTYCYSCLTVAITIGLKLNTTYPCALSVCSKQQSLYYMAAYMKQCRVLFILCLLCLLHTYAENLMKKMHTMYHIGYSTHCFAIHAFSHGRFSLWYTLQSVILTIFLGTVVEEFCNDR